MGVTTMPGTTAAGSRWLVRGVIGGALALGITVAIGAATAASADEHTFDRGIAAACTSFAQGSPAFRDVPPSATHAAAINCVSFWEVAQGREGEDLERDYDPGGSVDRAAMASFIARVIDRLPDVDLPDAADETFPDVAGTHADNVHRLRAAGIVAGRADGTYGPADEVTRAAMASYIAHMIESVTGDDLATGETEPAFPDTGDPHGTNIDKLAAIGVVQGFDDGTYGSAQPVTRAAMASFIARSLDHLAELGHLPVPFELSLEPTTDLAPENLHHRVEATVTDQFGDGFFGADIRFEVLRAGAQVLAAQHVSEPGGELVLSYNADARPDVPDRVVACIVGADEAPTGDGSFCVRGDDQVLVEDRAAADVTVEWAAAVPARDADPDEELGGDVITVDPGNEVVYVQTRAGAGEVGDFVRVPYADDAVYDVAGQPDVTIGTFVCALERTVDEQGSVHRLSLRLDPDGTDAFTLATSTDVSTCF